MIEIKIIRRIFSDSADIRLYGSYPSAIIIGENHANPSHIQPQIECVNYFGPPVLLHRMLRSYVFDSDGKSLHMNKRYPLQLDHKLAIQREGVKADDSSLLSWAVENGVTIALDSDEYRCFCNEWREPSGLKRHIENSKMSVIGSGISYAERSYLAKTVCAGHICPDPDEMPNEIDHRNQIRAAEIISSAETTNKPLIAIEGRSHLRGESLLHNLLHKAGVDYITVSQPV